MILNCIFQTIDYVVNQPFFWASMGFTTLIGIFIGSVIYDGDMAQIKKALIALSSYCLMLVVSTLTRVLPQIPIVEPIKTYQLFAGVTTISVVTFFYLLGMFLGVYITKKAHKEI